MFTDSELFTDNDTLFFCGSAALELKLLVGLLLAGSFATPRKTTYSPSIKSGEVWSLGLQEEDTVTYSSTRLVWSLERTHN